MVTGLQTEFISNNRYSVRFAETEDDLKAAQRLRFNVFNIELGEGLESSYDSELDKDEFDDQCHHLLVIDKTADKVIGTYRMQTYSIAKKHKGFYTATEYDLSSIPQEVLDSSVEVGRACIEAEHRNGRVLYLLWRGVARYLVHFNKTHLLGCCSLTSQSCKEAWSVMEYLNRHCSLHSEIMVSATEKYHCDKVEPVEEMIQSVKLPQLFRLYMDLGAKVCSPPALDREFKTIDFLVLLNIDGLDERTKMLFFK